MTILFQAIDKYALKSLLENKGYWDKIHDGTFLEKIQRSSPAKIVSEGTSLILSYYDTRLVYVCTIHRVVTKDGVVIHEDVKDGFIDGVHYRAQ